MEHTDKEKKLDYQLTLEAASQAKNFRISDCYGLRDALSLAGRSAFDQIENNLDTSAMDYVHNSVVRNAFFIELVNREITSTKFQCRWTSQLNNDPRYADYSECLLIAEKMLAEIAELPNQSQLFLSRFKDYNSIPYELPFDYADRYALHLHAPENIDLKFGAIAQKALKLRMLIRDKSKNPDTEAFRKILSDKIKVKAYLTDRAQTGLYQTNREKRWETHPNSVQYALRLDCMEIESALILQIAKFKGANTELVASLQQEKLLPEEFEYARCPITGELLEYETFINGVLNPSHGRSPFQVGHLNPLKTVSNGDVYGHTVNNISWISDDGNRIQGSLSMEEVDELLIKTYINRDFASKVEYYRVNSEAVDSTAKAAQQSFPQREEDS